MADPNPNRNPSRPKIIQWPSLRLLLLLLTPVVLSIILYKPRDFEAAPLPGDYPFSASLAVPERHGRVLAAAERLGEGVLLGPEDLAYDGESGYLYTGCYDGWIRRIRLIGDEDGELPVEDWVRVRGRPLGIAFSPDRSLIVADAYEGLLKVKPDKEVELLTNEAEGLKFKLTDGVDVSSDGVIYFTDASYKYNLEIHMLDILEARPHGRLMSFDPSTNRTAVLARDLYFANGVSLAPDQDSLIFCETVLRRCRRYHIRGEKRGTIDKFIENLPGFPDNIRYDNEGHYWIALSAGRTISWDIMYKYPIIRKILFILEKFVTVPHNLRDSGGLSVTLEGKPLTLYTDPDLILATGWLKIGRYLYYGSLHKDYLSRIDLTQYVAEEK
ncbi:protein STRICTOSIDINE SYNTHASE-LIKE 6-like [Typha latifolia]|uniref:protein STRICTOSIDINE SYNTHASE-LIKE 6-like n=1 Tax=Typha latifolia TaxID=4733 RepID=UPI003C2DDC88